MITLTLTSILATLGAFLLAELFGMLPVAVFFRQIRGLLSLWRTFAHGRGSSDTNCRGAVKQEFSFWSRVWLSDVDLFMHMNNCRYYQRCEEGRYHFLMRSGVGALMYKKGHKAGVAGCVVRFRRELKPLQAFQVKTSLAGWDERSFFIEHKFCAPDGFVHAQGLSIYKLTKAMLKKGITPASILRELEDNSALTISDLQMDHEGLRGLKAFEDWSSEDCSSTKQST